MTERTVVIMPTSDEPEKLEGVVRRLRRSVPDVEVLIVDDVLDPGSSPLLVSHA